MKDANYILEAVNSYVSKDFDGMTNLIIDYPASDFFFDLYEHLNLNTYDSPRNKYIYFVGITIEFSKIVSKYLKPE